jgi:hypothetical protein
LSGKTVPSDLQLGITLTIGVRYFHGKLEKAVDRTDRVAMVIDKRTGVKGTKKGMKATVLDK